MRARPAALLKRHLHNKKPRLLDQPRSRQAHGAVLKYYSCISGA